MNAPRIPIARIQALVAEHFGVRPIDMTSDRRARAVSHPRQVAIWLARRHTTLSLPAIGRHFGDRDHSTVMYACRRIESFAATDPDLAAAIAAIEARLLDPKTPTRKDLPDV